MAPSYLIGSTYPPSTHRHSRHGIKLLSREEISANINEQRTLGLDRGVQWIWFELQYYSFTHFLLLGYWSGYGGNILGVKKAMNSTERTVKQPLIVTKPTGTGSSGQRLL
jgi:hypothetical protein